MKKTVGEPEWVRAFLGEAGIKKADHANMGWHDHTQKLGFCMRSHHSLDSGDGAELLGELIAEVRRQPMTASITGPKYVDLRKMLSGSGGELVTRFYETLGVLITIKGSSLTIERVASESRTTSVIKGKKTKLKAVA